MFYFKSKTLSEHVKQLLSRLIQTNIPLLISLLFLGFICFVALHDMKYSAEY